MAVAAAQAPSWRHRVARLLGDPVIRDLRPYWQRVEAIEARANRMRGVADDDLRDLLHAAAPLAREELWQGANTAEAMAVVREAARRGLGQWPYPEQLLAGLCMLDGRVAEMATGEGKTLAAVAPAAVNAASGSAVHVISCNEYLARRDAEWMAPVYELLGLQVAWIGESCDLARRRAAYGTEICYLTAHELGFDFLSDRLCLDPQLLVRQRFAFALVDEADSILIDEARIPLVIAGHETAAPITTDRLARLAEELAAGRDYETDENARNVFVTDAGARRAEAALQCGDLFTGDQLELLADLRNALHAKALLTRDVDYIVRDGRVELVDDFSGRVAELRRWPDGLQAAVEAKERVAVQREGRVLGTTTVRHLLDRYDAMAGMTATAATAGEELAEMYGMEVVVIPPHRPCRRQDHPDLIFTHRAAKTQAVVAEVCAAHASGRPVLVGTASVAESEELAAALRAAGVPLSVLNARHDAEEAAIVARAGALGAVTISTNMAGRGTDIRLGGPDEHERAAVAALGGLYVIGTNRHESGRVDLQLRGRAGRQGDPGSSRFFISLEDPLLERYGLAELIPESHRPEAQPESVDDPVVSRAVDAAQRIIEGASFDARRRLDRYSGLIEGQRHAVQSWRQRLLAAEAEVEALDRLVFEQRPELQSTLSAGELDAVARRLTLLAIDRCWADHLAEAQRIKDGIHVVGFVGKDPLTEYTRELGEAFSELQQLIDEDVAASLRALEIGASGVSWEQDGLQGPSATWTYMIHDEPFGSNQLRALANRAGLATGAAIFAGPILLLWSLLVQWRQRLDKRRRAR